MYIIKRDLYRLNWQQTGADFKNAEVTQNYHSFFLKPEDNQNKGLFSCEISFSLIAGNNLLKASSLPIINFSNDNKKPSPGQVYELFRTSLFFAYKSYTDHLKAINIFHKPKLLLPDQSEINYLIESAFLHAYNAI